MKDQTLSKVAGWKMLEELYKKEDLYRDYRCEFGLRNEDIIIGVRHNSEKRRLLGAKFYKFKIKTDIDINDLDNPLFNYDLSIVTIEDNALKLRVGAQYSQTHITLSYDLGLNDKDKTELAKLIL